MAKSKLTICYYISGHGYGHAARACQVMAALPADCRIIVRSQVDKRFLEREAGRKLQVVAGQFDVGVKQADNQTLDWDATIAEAHRVIHETSAGMVAETDFLRKHRVDVVVCDVASAPLEAARLCGVPSVVVGNFTWVEIFEKEGRKRPAAAELAEQWREEYGLATLAIRTEPAFPMKYFRWVETAELVARRGKNVRAVLRRALGVVAGQRLVLLYFGTFGDGQLKVPQLDGVTFVSFTDMPAPVVKLNAGEWNFPDVVASVDCVMAKPGYGTIGECMANGTPVVFYQRNDFAEYPVLRNAITAWGGGVCLGSADFRRGKWAAALDEAFALKPRKVSNRGAQQVARWILSLADDDI